MLLWIAFKSLSLCWQEQHIINIMDNFYCCELLSNHYLCADKNSPHDDGTARPVVVNCFQIIIFVLTRTAKKTPGLMANSLWIAFKSLSLCWQEQLQQGIWRRSRCCELLSNHYLCADKNSKSFCWYAVWKVVNCFQIIIFVLTRTANIIIVSVVGQLWIAFKSLSLCWQEQQVVSGSAKNLCCELLSNHYLCADKNSLC